MKKAIFLLMAATAIVFSMNSCKKVTKDVVTTVSNGGSNEGLTASSVLVDIYVDAIQAEQSGSAKSGNHVVWKNQTSSDKAIETAKTAAERAKQSILSSEITMPDGETKAVMTEATKDDFDCEIGIEVDNSLILTHYYKTTVK